MLELNGKKFVISYPVSIDGYIWTLTSNYSLTNKVSRILAEERRKEEVKIEDVEIFCRRYMNTLNKDNTRDYRYYICYIDTEGLWLEVYDFANFCKQAASKFVPIGDSMWWSLMPWGEIYFKYEGSRDGHGYDVADKYKVFASYDAFLDYLGVSTP